MHFLGPFLEHFRLWGGKYVSEDYEAVVDKKSNLILSELGGSSHLQQHKQYTVLKQVVDGQAFQKS